MYIEIYLFLGLFIHSVFGFIAYLFLERRVNKFNLILSNILDLIYMLLFIKYPYKIENYKFLFIGIISASLFIRFNLKDSFTGIFIYLALNFLLGGISEVLYLSSLLKVYYIFIICVILLIMFLLIKIYKQFFIKKNKFYYEIKIINERKTYYLNGFLDTGNIVFYYPNIPVVFINNKDFYGKFYDYLEVDSINGLTKVPIYKVDEFYIKINKRFIKKNIFISFTKMNIDCIFGLSIIGG